VLFSAVVMLVSSTLGTSVAPLRGALPGSQHFTLFQKLLPFTDFVDEKGESVNSGGAEGSEQRADESCTSASGTSMSSKPLIFTLGGLRGRCGGVL